MADFRKWLFAFAVVALLIVAGVPAHAQIVSNSAVTCTANAANPPIVRAEGVTELVGDIVLQCIGGTSTAVGVAIPTSNFQIFMNTNVTSRLMNTQNASEAVMLIDEPYAGTPAGSADNPTTVVVPANSAPQGFCPFPYIANGCFGVGLPMVGTGGGNGATGPYKTINIFQGVQNGVNSVAWLGVPFDAPGTNLIRTIRITNLRANACLLGVSSTLIPTQLTVYIAVNGSQQVTIANPQLTVGFVEPGLSAGNKTATYLQCNNLNPSLITSGSTTGGITSGPINITVTEGFASSFKPRSYNAPGTAPSGFEPQTVGNASSISTLQDVPGFPYNSESGFVSPATGGAVTGAIGVADQGTQISVSFASVGAGVGIFVPATVNLIDIATGGVSGKAILIAGATGTGTLASVTLSGGAGVVTYETIYSNPSAVETMVVGVTVSFVSSTGTNLPATGTTTAAVNFAPLSGTAVAASATAPIPRFCQTHPANNLFTINLCVCDLLFPFVTNQAGFDTGIAIANTTSDPWGTSAQAGTIKLWYYGNTTGGGAAPAAQVSTSVASGTEAVFTLSNGGTNGIAATPGFQGYIIAVSNFQLCHGFAFISDVGAQKLAEGYLAIQLDTPFNLGYAGTTTRTGQFGEVQAH